MNVAGSAVVAGADRAVVPCAVLAAAYSGVHGVAVASAGPGCVANGLDSGQAIAVPVAELEAEAGLVEGMEASGKVACVGHRQQALSASGCHSCPPCQLFEACCLPAPGHRHPHLRQRQQLLLLLPPRPRLLCVACHEVGQYRVSWQRTVSLVLAVAEVGQLISPRRSDLPCGGGHVSAWEVFHQGRVSFEKSSLM